MVFRLDLCIFSHLGKTSADFGVIRLKERSAGMIVCEFVSR